MKNEEMRNIKYIAVHCTASSQKWGVRDLETEFRRKGWKNPGYHYVITADGVVHQLLDEEKVSNGVRGYNTATINIAYVGGVDTDNKLKPVDNRTEAQRKSLRVMLKSLYYLSYRKVIAESSFARVPMPRCIFSTCDLRGLCTPAA